MDKSSYWALSPVDLWLLTHDACQLLVSVDPQFFLTHGFCSPFAFIVPWILLKCDFWWPWLLAPNHLGPLLTYALCWNSSCRPAPSVNPWLVLGRSNPSEDSGFQKTRSQFRVGLGFQQRSAALVMETAEWCMIPVHFVLSPTPLSWLHCPFSITRYLKETMKNLPALG